MSAPGPGGRQFLLFVYDAWMTGLPEAARLDGAERLGPAATEARFELVDLGTQVALMPGGAASVRGEVVSLPATLLASLDIERGHPLRFKRVRIRLDDGREAEAYTVDPDQARGRRRIRSGDYRTHVSPAAPERSGSAWSKWARSRGSGR
jgi:gamma-glutamylcyclotransferase (GGCT)/AIG2-like uncharacterized protein YtfP